MVQLPDISGPTHSQITYVLSYLSPNLSITFHVALSLVGVLAHILVVRVALLAAHAAALLQQTARMDSIYGIN